MDRTFDPLDTGRCLAWGYAGFAAPPQAAHEWHLRRWKLALPDVGLDRPLEVIIAADNPPQNQLMRNFLC